MDDDYPPALYADTRDRAITLFRSCSDEQAAEMVPLNPAWTVRNVAAHVCGIVDDVLHGNTDGLGTDAWTQAQVEKRAAHSLDQICTEWEAYADRIDAMTAKDTFFGVRLAGDLILHLQDVQHALGRKVDTASNAATLLAAHRYVAPLQERALEQLNLGVAIQLTDGQAYEPSPGADETIALHCSSYDFLRSVTGRRSRRQVQALEWQDDPSALLDGPWNTYGALHSADVTV